MKLFNVFLISVFITVDVYSQGLNNDQYSFDKTDSENIAEFFLGIETYKFYVNAKINDYFDIIIEEYSNKKLISTSSEISEMTKLFGVNPLNPKFGDDFIRIYVKDNTQAEHNVELRIKYLNLTIPKKYENLNLESLQSRAFSNISTDINEKTAVLTIYGNKEEDLISCPGDARPKDIVNLYDWVCILYLDKIE